MDAWSFVSCWHWIMEIWSTETWMKDVEVGELKGIKARVDVRGACILDLKC